MQKCITQRWSSDACKSRNGCRSITDWKYGCCTINFPLVSGEVPYTSLLTGWIIEGLQARYPYLRVGTIGRSVMGTPLWSLQLGNGPVEVGYNASFHANESITTPVLLKFVEQLLEAYADERMYEELYPSGCLKNIPCILYHWSIRMVWIW